MSKDTNADFTPNLNDYKDYKYNIRPFNLFCAQNFPLIEENFDALTTYQLLCKLNGYLNQIITNLNITEDNMNKQNENIEMLLNSYNELQNYVNHYFDNLDVQEEINNKLDQMAQDGTLGEVMQKYIQPYIDEINSQFNDFKSETNSKIENIIPGTPKKSFTSVQNLIENNPDTGVYLVSENGHIYYWVKNSSQPEDLGLYLSSSYYQGNIFELGFTKFEDCKKDGYYNFSINNLSSFSDIPSDLTNGGILIVNIKGAGGQAVFQQIIDTVGNSWFRIGNNPFLKVFSNDFMQYRGNILSLGFTSFEECIENGYYSFSTSNLSSITDKPSNLTSGGFLLNFKKTISGNVISQIVYDSSGNSWFRYGNNPFTQITSKFLFNYRGSIINNGFTKFEDCKEDGYYSFSTKDLSSITDKPSNLTKAGNLLVFSKSGAGSVIIQNIQDVDGNIWFRYGNNPFIQITNPDNFAYRGKILSLGFTSFEQCIEDGYYSFSTADLSTITDKPSNLTRAGNLLVFSKSAAGSVIFQYIQDLNGNTWFRYGNLPFTQITHELSNAINWIALGDSITQGFYSYFNEENEGVSDSTTKDCWVNICAKLSNYNVTNSGVGGSGFVHKGTVGDKLSGREHIETIDFNNYDLVTLAWGVNDWKYNEPLGTFEDDISTGGTIYSNMRYIIEKILQDNPNIKIIVITPINCSQVGNYENKRGIGYPYSNNGTLQKVTEALIEVCNYYGIEYINMTNYSSVNRNNINEILPDKVHPSIKGHFLLGHELSKKINF